MNSNHSHEYKKENKQMILGMLFANNFGLHPATWRMPHINIDNYADINETLKHFQKAEEGGLQFIFIPDRLYMNGNFAETPSAFNIDPFTTLTAVAQGTSRIGLAGTASTSFYEPYILARQLKALDLYSGGRVGWNAVPSYEPEVFANFGQPLPPREKKYERLHEMIQTIQTLWGSWAYEAGEPYQNGKFADQNFIQPVNLQGQYVGSRGPLPVPPSRQGQPIIIMPASSGYGLQAAAMYADVVIGMSSTIEDGVYLRNMLRQAAVDAGRDTDDIKYVIFMNFTVGKTKREALDKRRALDDKLGIQNQLTRLSAYLGLNEVITHPDQPLSNAQLSKIRTQLHDERVQHIVDLAMEGWSPRDILAHKVFDVNPGLVSTGEDIADYLEEWFEAGAADGFILTFDDLYNDISDFVEHVVPILRDRGIFPKYYNGTTLRDNLGIRHQYGFDSRVKNNAQGK